MTYRASHHLAPWPLPTSSVANPREASLSAVALHLLDLPAVPKLFAFALSLLYPIISSPPL